MKLSVIIPVFRTESTLDRCVESVINQHISDMEIILVDDGSPDGCPLLCEKWAKKDSRVIVIHKNNGGLSDARNAALDIANGQYITFVDSDDYVDSFFIEKMLAKAIDTQSDVVICNTFNVYNNKIKVNPPIQEVNRSELIKQLLIGTAHNALWNKLVKRSIIVDNDLYPEDCFRILEDKSISFRMVYFANKIEYVNEPVYFYRKREDSLTKNNQRVLLPMLKSIMRLVDEFFRIHPMDETIESGIKSFKVGVAGSLLIYKPDDEDLKLLMKEKNKLYKSLLI